MLKKILKFEWKHTAKFMGIVYLILAIATIMGCFGLHSLQADSGESELLAIFSVILFSLYVVSIIGICIMTFIYQCYHYYQTTYSAQGYLTFTLPVKPITIFNGKLIMSFGWMLITGILSCLSVFILLVCGIGTEFITELFEVDWAQLSFEMQRSLGMSFPGFIAYMIVCMLLGLLSYLLFVYVCMAIGQLFHSNRVAFSVLAGFVIYVAMQIISSIVTVISGYRGYSAMLRGDTPGSVTTPLFVMSIVLSLIYIGAMYFGTYKITKDHLNLE